MDTNKFIENAIKIHGNKYDYSKVNYLNNKKDVIIVCRLHGEFLQRPNNHLCGNICPECSKILNLEKKREKFIKKAHLKHNNKYDYSKVIYKDQLSSVIIICNEKYKDIDEIHGEFNQRPTNHLNGQGCNKCSGQYMDNELFIKKSKIIHNDKYDYSVTKYLNSQTKINIICNIHGEFNQSPNDHLQGTGCKKCGYEKNSLNNTITSEEFIKRQQKFIKINMIIQKPNMCVMI